MGNLLKIVVLLGCSMFISFVVYAMPASQMTTQDASDKARLSYMMSSVDGKAYDLYVISDDDHRMSQKWIWKSHDYEENWQGHYYLYLAPVNSNTVVRQSVRTYSEYFADYKDEPTVVNVTYPNFNGYYVVSGKYGMPDILIHTVKMTGGGFYNIQIYAIKNGKLQQIKFLNKETKKTYYTHSAGSQEVYYLEDGTFAIPWWSNAKPGGGEFISVYMLDKENLTLIHAYTVRK